MNISAFKKILPVIRMIDTPPGKGKSDRTLDISKSISASGFQYLQIKGEDLNTQLKILALGVDANDGSSCVNADKFCKLFSTLKSLPQVIFGDGLTVKFDKRVISLEHLSGIARMDYGNRSYVPDSPGVNWETSRLVEGLAYVSQAMSDDVTRFHLCGVLLSRNGDLVGCDGHRLHVYDYKDGNAAESFFTDYSEDTILPAQTVKMLQSAIKACGGNKAEVYSSRNSSHVRFVIDGGGISIEITSKLVDSQYPPYHNVIPKSHKSLCEVNAGALVEACKLLVKLDDSFNHTLEFSLNGALHIRGGGVSETLETTRNEGDKFEFGSYGANGQYFVEAASLPGQEVVIEIGDSLDPILFRQGSFLAVVMPKRV